MPVKMTRSEYEAKYGSAPTPTASAAPVKMTRSEYEAKYGVAPKKVEPEKGLGDKLIGRFSQGLQGAAKSVVTPGVSPIAPIPGGRTFLRAAGAAGGAVGDVVGAAVSAITPDAVEKKVGDVVAPVAAPIMKAGKKIFSAVESLAPETAQDIKDAANATNLFVGGAAAKAPAQAAVKNVIKPAAQVAAKATTPAAEGIIANINRITPAKRQQFKAMQGVSEEQWLRERGIVGTREDTVGKLLQNFTELRTNVDEALEAIPGNFRDPRVTQVAEEAAEYAKSVEDKLAGSLSALAEKAKGVGLTTKEINEVKRYYERNVKMGYLKDPNKVSGDGVRATNRDSRLREYLLDIAEKSGFPEMRQMNKDIQANKFLANEIAGRMEGQAANNPMSLTDWIVVTPSLVHPAALAGFIGKKFLSTEGVRAFAARAMAGFPTRKPVLKADLAEIRRRAEELAKKTEEVRGETEKAALLSDELMKAGYIIGPGERGFIMQNPVPLTRQEQLMIRAAKNKEEQEQMARYILEQRAEGKAVGEGFTMKDIDNTPLLNPTPKDEMGIIDIGTPKVFRGVGGSHEFSGKSAVAKGRNYSLNRDRASAFGSVSDFSINPEANIVQIDMTGRELMDIAKELGVTRSAMLSPDLLTKQLLEKGYDGIIYTDRLTKGGDSITDLIDFTGKSIVNPKKKSKRLFGGDQIDF